MVVLTLKGVSASTCVTREVVVLTQQHQLAMLRQHQPIEGTCLKKCPHFGGRRLEGVPKDSQNPEKIASFAGSLLIAPCVTMSDRRRASLISGSWRTIIQYAAVCHIASRKAYNRPPHISSAVMEGYWERSVRRRCIAKYTPHSRRLRSQSCGSLDLLQTYEYTL